MWAAQRDLAVPRRRTLSTAPPYAAPAPSAAQEPRRSRRSAAYNCMRWPLLRRTPNLPLALLSSFDRRLAPSPGDPAFQTIIPSRRTSSPAGPRLPRARRTALRLPDRPPVHPTAYHSQQSARSLRVARQPCLLPHLASPAWRLRLRSPCCLSPRRRPPCLPIAERACRLLRGEADGRPHRPPAHRGSSTQGGDTRDPDSFSLSAPRVAV